jgi:hypothetical protein
MVPYGLVVWIIIAAVRPQVKGFEGVESHQQVGVRVGVYATSVSSIPEMRTTNW